MASHLSTAPSGRGRATDADAEEIPHRHRLSEHDDDTAVLWIGAFLALSTGWQAAACALAGSAAFLAVVQIVSFAAGGASANMLVTAGGVTGLGLVPALALLVPGARSAFHRRLDWLTSGLIAVMLVSLFDDGVTRLASGGMRIGLAELNGVLRAVWAGWVACIVVLAWQGRSSPVSRLAALFSRLPSDGRGARLASQRPHGLLRRLGPAAVKAPSTRQRAPCALPRRDPHLCIAAVTVARRHDGGATASERAPTPGGSRSSCQ